MPKTATQLDDLLSRLRQLPDAQQQLAVEALREIVEAPYQLTGAELEVLRPALAEASRGENLTDAEADDILTKPWG